MDSRILIVDDEAPIRALLGEHLNVGISGHTRF